jgi:hypothetical protein
LYDIQEMDRTVKKQEDIEAQEIKKEFDLKTPPKVSSHIKNLAYSPADEVRSPVTNLLWKGNKKTLVNSLVRNNHKQQKQKPQSFINLEERFNDVDVLANKEPNNKD